MKNHIHRELTPFFDPLAKYRIFQTKDMDEARDRVAKIFSPHELGFSRRQDSRLETAMSHYPMGSISLNRLRYGGCVDVDAGCLNSYFLVQIPLSGHTQINCGNQSINSSPKLGSVISPTLPLFEQIDASCDKLALRIDRALLERICSEHLGHPLRQPIEFDLELNLSDPSKNSLSALIAYLVNEVDNQSPLMNFPLVQCQVEHLVVTSLLFKHKHNYSSALTTPPKATTPRHLKRVEEFIDAHADQPITVAQLAAYAQVSSSTLYQSFREIHNYTPMTYLKAVRLRRVNQELRSTNQTSEKVTNVAMRWGFTHLGFFARDYKKMFGELPSETLRK
ncbi:MAG: AraC family transcriptional regulator [Sterolibacterium sp.]